MQKVLTKVHKVLTKVHKVLTKVHKVLTKVHKVLTKIYKKKWLKHRQTFISTRSRFSCLTFQISKGFLKRFQLLIAKEVGKIVLAGPKFEFCFTNRISEDFSPIVITLES